MFKKLIKFLLNEDLEQIKKLEETNRDAIKILMKNDIAILEHLKTNNATKEMSYRQKETEEFLIEEL